MDLLRHLDIKVHPDRGETILLLGGKIDFGKDEGTSIVIAKRIVPVLDELGAELPDDLDLDKRPPLEDRWELTTATLPNKNGDIFDFERINQFHTEHSNRLVSMEHINQIMKRPNWATQIVCPVMKKWVEDLSWPLIGIPTDVQLFTCGVVKSGIPFDMKPNFLHQKLMDRNLPMQRAIWPNIPPADRIRGASTDLLGLGPS